LKLNNKIKFYPVSTEAGELIEPPTPAYKHNIPDWFRNLPKYAFGSSKFFYNKGPNLTAKSCLPLVDAFTSGYTINLHCDIQVKKENGNIVFTWAYRQNGVPEPVGQRNTNKDAMVCGWDDIYGYEDLNFNWFPSWSIKTPPGYSCIFTHPINRVDLPFYTLGGVIDTDGWGDAGNHPFLLKKDWEGIIPKGTPIIQVIPFKRQDWSSDADKDMTKEYNKKIAQKNSYLKDYYKKFVWSSKSYK
jgi:hypothetical protein